MRAKPILTCLICLLLLVSFAGSPSYATVEVTCFSKDYTREKGKPIIVTDTFTSALPSARLIITNGDPNDLSVKRVTAATIQLNGNKICDSNDFNDNVRELIIDVDLIVGNNTINVLVKDPKGGTFTVRLVHDVEAETAAYVGPEGGIIAVTDQESPLNGMSIYFPPSSITENCIVTINIPDNVQPNNKNFLIGPVADIATTHQIVGYVQVRLPITEQLAMYDLPIIYTEDENGGWDVIPNVYVENGFLMYETTHFSHQYPTKIEFNPDNYNDGKWKLLLYNLYKSMGFPNFQRMEANLVDSIYSTLNYQRFENASTNLAKTVMGTYKQSINPNPISLLSTINSAQGFFNDVTRSAYDDEKLSEGYMGLVLCSLEGIGGGPAGVIASCGDTFIFSVFDMVTRFASTIYVNGDLKKINNINIANDYLTLYYIYGKDLALLVEQEDLNIDGQLLDEEAIIEAIALNYKKGMFASDDYNLNAIIDLVEKTKLWIEELAWGLDLDKDGILDDGNGSGINGDAPCLGGETENCDDNCPTVSNTDQADSNGDGIGDVCEKVLTFEDYTLACSFDSDGLYNLVGLYSWNGNPVDEQNRPTDYQRQLKATVNLYVHPSRTNVLYVQVKDVQTSRFGWASGTVFSNITLTGVQLHLLNTTGANILDNIVGFSSDYANPNQLRLFDSQSEVLYDTPGYELEFFDDAVSIHTTNGAYNGFTSFPSVWGTSRIWGGGIFELTFNPWINLLEDVNWNATQLFSEWGTGNQYIEAFYVPSTQPSVPLVYVSPTLGPRGTLFNEPGYGFTPNSNVTLYFRSPDGSLSTVSKTTNDFGHYTHSHKSQPDIPIGDWEYYAVDETTGTPSASVNLIISEDPYTEVSPTSGPRETAFNQSGYSFTPNSAVKLYFLGPDDSHHEAFKVTDSAGNFTYVYQSDLGTAMGDWEYYAVDLSTGTRTVSVYFAITGPRLQVSSTSSPLCSSLGQSGSGFTPGGTAELHFRRPDGSLSPTTTEAVEADGTYQHYWTVPSDAQLGQYQYWAVDLSTGQTSPEVNYWVQPNVPNTPTIISGVYQSSNNWNYITWSAVNCVTEYHVYWGTSPGVTKSSNMLTPTTTTDYGHSGVQSGYTYYYRVSAVNASGESPLSNEKSVYVP